MAIWFPRDTVSWRVHDREGVAGKQGKCGARSQRLDAHETSIPRKHGVGRELGGAARVMHFLL